MTGLSITLCFGKYAGFYAQAKANYWRMCVGWVALTLWTRTDVEELIKFLISDRNRLKEWVSELEKEGSHN